MLNKESDSLSNISKEEVLLRLLQKERGYYSAILELTRQEGELIAKSHAGKELQSLTKKKQILFSCIEEIESALQPLKSHWQNKQDKQDVLSRSIKEELSHLDKTLSSILQADQANQQILTHYLLSLKDRATLLHKSPGK